MSVRRRGSTFDMRGVTRLAGARPLDGRVGRHLWGAVEVVEILDLFCRELRVAFYLYVEALR